MADRDFSRNAEQAKNAARDVARDAQDTANSVARDAKGAVNNVARDAKGAARDAQDTARDVASDAKGTAKNVARDAQDVAKDAKASADRALANDGVYNSKGFAMAAAGPVFLAAIPVTSWITQPGGLLEKVINGLIGGVGLFASAGASSSVAQGGKIAALAALYASVTFAISGATSVAGQAAGNPQPYDNKHPRANINNLTGLPLRLYSAHHQLIEHFPGWAIAAALAQAIAPGDQHIINLLGLHVIAKVLVFFPAYVMNVDAPRSLGHLAATSSMLNVLFQLTKKPLV
ncbi:uncharacterized protein RCC_09054 [Ramularia collo-cygni]|uniref:Uncharacterized protein n=1 Tax=Ramularia collo-cygni TaxID=112498 RepID=A0A2D3VGQ3_9PEZI|nr:uncharacterized protein RCC_09054 [Ramularia collo-cygni]CZT23341.1 uncharacterized protein RCC_09054 [Ramularia collo-cygni]